MFLDTNVAASALATRGLCAEVLQVVLLRHRLLSCREVEVELRRTLENKFRLPADLVQEALRSWSKEAEPVSSEPLREVPRLDPADRAVASAAWNGEADFLVSGDAAIRALGRIGQVTIVSPREFWERLRLEEGDEAH